MWWIAGLLAIATIPAFIASRKTPDRAGQMFALFFVFGALLWIVALPVAIWVVKDERSKTCPHCAEKIKVAAKVCPRCQRDLEQASSAAASL